MIEGQAVVALRHGIVGVLERGGGRGELGGGVAIGAGRARRVDGALRLIHFLVGGVVQAEASSDDEQPRLQQRGTRDA